MSGIFDVPSNLTGDALKYYIWMRCRICPGFDENLWRYDSFGRPIKWIDYGSRSSQYGWEIDHVIPRAAGGADHHSNKQALHWEHNVKKGAGIF